MAPSAYMPRIRLQSCAPLDTLRAWFLIPDGIVNIEDLKSTLCSQLSILKEAHVRPEQLALEIGGFEVLNESSIEVVHEEDIVTLKRLDVAKENTQPPKRKINADASRSTGTKRRKLSHVNHPLPSKSSTTSSSGSDTSSLSSSSSSSSTSDTDSDSTSLDSSPSVRSCRPPPHVTVVGDRPIHKKVQQVTVPPGFGKPTTKARNKRRRIKRKILAANGKVDPDVSSVTFQKSSHVDTSRDEVTIDLPYDDIAANSTFTHDPPLSSLGNRNKPKGFKKSMQGVLPQKIVFDSTPTPSFIPPSERESLPPNIFVTSAIVEWRTGKGRRRDMGREEDTSVVETQDVQTHEEPKGSIDWSTVETLWDKYPKLAEDTNVPLNGVVGWKGFGLDPVTLTPQASLLHLGRVIALDADTLTFTPLTRNDVGPATFGRTQVEETESTEQTSTPLKDIWSGEWRLVSDQ